MERWHVNIGGPLPEGTTGVHGRDTFVSIGVAPSGRWDDEAQKAFTRRLAAVIADDAELNRLARVAA